MCFRTFKLAAKKSGSDRTLTHLVGLLPAVAGDQVLDLLLHVEAEEDAAETEGGNSPNPLKCTQWNTPTTEEEEAPSLTALQSHILRAPWRSNKPGVIPENELNRSEDPKNRTTRRTLSRSPFSSGGYSFSSFLFGAREGRRHLRVGENASLESFTILFGRGES